jgi:dienelactone hydrolase
LRSATSPSSFTTSCSSSACDRPDSSGGVVTSRLNRVVPCRRSHFLRHRPRFCPSYLPRLLHRCWPAAIPATASAASSAELVQVAPQAFESKQPLLGYLTRPNTKGPFPAVVLLHGCAGFGPRETHWADQLRSWGYVSLAIDSFTPRNVAGCNGATSGDEVDAFSALQYLTTQPFVIPDRVAVLGSSLGGIAAVDDVESNLWEQMYHARFRGAVAFYPTCTGDSGNVRVPTLVLIGEKDDWAWAQACRNMVDDANKKGAPIKLVVYPDATHDFDVPATVPYQILGHHMAYDPEATRDAEKQVRVFLHDILE